MYWIGLLNNEREERERGKIAKTKRKELLIVERRNNF